MLTRARSATIIEKKMEDSKPNPLKTKEKFPDTHSIGIM